MKKYYLKADISLRIKLEVFKKQTVNPMLSIIDKEGGQERPLPEGNVHSCPPVKENFTKDLSETEQCPECQI